MKISRSDIVAIVSSTRPDWTKSQSTTEQQRSAVVQILLAGKDGALEILLTRRADNLRIHAGQVSFPGGKPEPDDTSPAITAARECEEETGLDRQFISHLGYLEPILTSTNYLVDQAVGVIDEDPRILQSHLRPHSVEVDKAWFVQLAPLLVLKSYERASLQGADGRYRWFWKIAGTDPLIWGATAQMLRNLALKLHAQENVTKP